MAFIETPTVQVKMSVYDYADLLRKYAPPTVCVWYMPSTRELKAGFRDTADKDIVLLRNGEMCLDDDLDTLFSLVEERTGVTMKLPDNIEVAY